MKDVRKRLNVKTTVDEIDDRYDKFFTFEDIFLEILHAFFRATFIYF